MDVNIKSPICWSSAAMLHLAIKSLYSYFSFGARDEPAETLLAPPDLFKGAVKFIDLKKKTIKVAVFPCSLILWPKPCFCYLMRKICIFMGKNYNS